MLPDKEDAMEFKHKSIMLAETIESLHIKPDGIYVDGTLGGGGHSLEIAKRLTDGGRLIGIDQDGDAIEAAAQRLAPYSDRVTIVRRVWQRKRMSILHSFPEDRNSV